jgi:class 3 adenylate cyclase
MEGTFCFVDLSGFTALTEAHGAEAAADLVDRFTMLVRGALESHGRFVDRIGDAAFVVCPTADEGVAFVMHLFDDVAREADFPVLRAGLHHGEALERHDSFYGSTVNLAARVAARAGGGQVVATKQVAAAARGHGLFVESLGNISLRNVREPVELFLLNVSTAESTPCAACASTPPRRRGV